MTAMLLSGIHQGPPRQAVTAVPSTVASVTRHPLSAWKRPLSRFRKRDHPVVTAACTFRSPSAHGFTDRYPPRGVRTRILRPLSNTITGSASHHAGQTE
jgi:hypothetical protein